MASAAYINGGNLSSASHRPSAHVANSQAWRGKAAAAAAKRSSNNHQCGRSVSASINSAGVSVRVAGESGNGVAWLCGGVWQLFSVSNQYQHQRTFCRAHVSVAYHS